MRRNSTPSTAASHACAAAGPLSLETLNMEPIFLCMVFAIMWLSSALLMEDIAALRATERRLERCPVHA
jgi:hypothetical protein